MVKKLAIVVDCQYDFINENGTLYVPGGDDACFSISEFISEMDGVVFTVDWHPFNHCSFKANGGQWDVHCVNYSRGASIPYFLLLPVRNKPTTFLHKGTNPNVEEYGAFENEGNCAKLAKWLRTNFGTEKEIDVYVCGVAGDYCVIDTVKSFMNVKPKQIRNVFVIKDLCPSIDTSFDMDAACNECGAQTVMSNEIVNE